MITQTTELNKLSSTNCTDEKHQLSLHFASIYCFRYRNTWQYLQQDQHLENTPVLECPPDRLVPKHSTHKPKQSPSEQGSSAGSGPVGHA